MTAPVFEGVDPASDCDCPGRVPPGNEWTGSLGRYWVRITREELLPGDLLLHHNPDDPERGSRFVIFGGWTDRTHTSCTVHEQTPPATRRRAAPYPYWSNTDKYVPYRHKGVTPDTAGAAAAPVARPGVASFGPGADNAYVTPLGRILTARGVGADRAARTGHLEAARHRRDEDAGAGTAGPAAGARTPGPALVRPGAANGHVTRPGAQPVRKGFGRFHPLGPGPHRGDAGRRAVAALRRPHGRRGGAADGCPGPDTRRRPFA
ncbi:hypothetical protein [Streptomyces sp. NPDC006309]|uniref:hypothetical protein n=1 Tax=Streptomyces sp. NPDC006309 TaxID=3156749 RepID=UPI0033ACFDD0